VGVFLSEGGIGDVREHGGAVKPDLFNRVCMKTGGRAGDVWRALVEGIRNSDSLV